VRWPFNNNLFARASRPPLGVAYAAVREYTMNRNKASGEVREPDEFKHIINRRKRKQQRCV